MSDCFLVAFLVPKLCWKCWICLSWVRDCTVRGVLSFHIADQGWSQYSILSSEHLQEWFLIAEPERHKHFLLKSRSRKGAIMKQGRHILRSNCNCFLIMFLAIRLWMQMICFYCSNVMHFILKIISSMHPYIHLKRLLCILFVWTLLSGLKMVGRKDIENLSHLHVKECWFLLPFTFCPLANPLNTTPK